MSKQYPANDPILAEVKKKFFGGGSNSTAKPVSITYAMTDKEIEKRKAYNDSVNKGTQKQTYEQYTNTSLLKGKSSVTTPVLMNALNELNKQPKQELSLTAKPIAYEAVVNNAPSKLLSTPNAKLLQNVWKAEATVNNLINTGALTGSKALIDAQAALEKAKQYYTYYNSPKKQLDSFKLNSNQQVTVKTLMKSDLENIQRAQECGTLQTVFVRADEKYICTTKTPWNAAEISSHYLNGIREGDRTVLFDTVTGQFYRVDSDTEESASVKKQMEKLSAQIETTYAALEKVKTEEEYETKLNELKSFYTTYQELQTQYDSFGLSDVVMNKDWADADKANVAKVNKAREEFKKHSDYYYSDATSSTQVNSVLDAVRRFASKTMFDAEDKYTFKEASEGFIKDLCETFSRDFIRPIEYVIKNSSKGMTNIEFANNIATAAGMMLSNTLVNLGETLDFTNAFKPGNVSTAIYGDQELMQKAGVTKYYDKVNSMSDEEIIAIANSTDPRTTELTLNLGGTPKENMDNLRKYVMGNMVSEAYWSEADVSTPTFEYEMTHHEEDKGFLTFISDLALDIVLDPATWLSIGMNQMYKAGTLIDDVANAIDVTIKNTDSPDLLKEIDSKKLAKRILRDAIDNNTPIDDTIVKQLAQDVVYKAVQGGTLDAVIRNLPEDVITGVFKNSADELYKAADVLNTTSASRSKLVKDARTRVVSSMYTVLKGVSDDMLKESLGDSYKMIKRMQKVKRAYDFIDSVAFNLVIPVRPVKFLAGTLLKGIEKGLDVTNASIFLGRVNGKIKRLFGNSGIPANRADEALGVVLKELKNTTGKVFTSEEAIDIANKAQRFIHSDLVDRYANSFLSILSSSDSAVNRMDALAAYLKKLDIDGVTDVSSFIKYLKQPFKNSPYSLYDMVDNKVVGKLRAMQDMYKMTKHQASKDNLKALLDVAEHWKDNTNKAFNRLAKQRGNVADSLSVAQAEYNAVISILDDSRKIFVDGVSTVSKQELYDSIEAVQKAITDIVDARLAGTRAQLKPVERAMDRVQELFNKYADDVRDANMLNIYSMNKKVERKVFDDVKVPRSKKLSSKKFISAVQEYMSKKYNVQVSRETLSDIFLRRIVDEKANVDFNDMLRDYVGMVSKSDRMMRYVVDGDLMTAIEPFISSSSVIHDGIRLIENHEINSALFKLREEVITYSITKSIVEQVSAMHTAPAYVQGVIDAISGEQAYINQIWKNVDVYAPNEVEYAIDNITDHLVNKASEYLANKASVDTKLFTVKLGGVRKKMCTLDTEENVLELVDSMKHISKANEYLAEDADNCYDVYFSIAKQNEHGDPVSITLRYPTDDGYKTVTYRNADVIYNPTANYVRYNHGVSRETALATYKTLESGEALSKAAFDEAVGNALTEIKHYASAGEQGNKSIRFIGYNNGIMGTNQDRTLNTFIRKNALTVHNDITVDVADFIRLERGLPVFNTETREALHDVIRSNANTAIAQGTKSLLSTFDDKFLIGATALSKALHDNYAAMTAKYPVAWLDSLRNSIDNLHDARYKVSNELNRVAATFEDVYIREKAIVDLINQFNPSKQITSVNIHAMLQDVMKYTDVDLTLNVQKIADATAYKYLYDLNKLSRRTVYDNLEVLREVSNNLFGTIEKIRQPEVIHYVGAEQFRKFIDTVNKTVSFGTTANDVYVRFLTDYVDDKNPIVLFSACKYINDRYHKRIADALRKNPNLFDDCALAYSLALKADDLVFNTSTSLFTMADDLNKTKLFKEFNQYSQYLVDMETFQYLSRDVEDLNTYFAMFDALLESSSAVSATEKVAMENFRQCAQPYMELALCLNVGSSDVYANADKLVKLEAIASHSKKVADVKNNINAIGTLHRTAAMRTVFELSDEDFFVYLVRDCKNTCIVDTASTLMQDADTRRVVINRIKSLERNNLFTVDYGKDGFIRIFHNVDNLKDVDMDKFYRALSKHRVDYAAGYDIALKDLWDLVKADKMHGIEYSETLKKVYECYDKACNKMQEYMPDHWVVSTYGVNTQTTAEHLQELFPDNAKLNTADMGVYGMFDNSYTCSVWADSKTIRDNDMIMYYSDDVVKSMGTGLYQVRSNLEAVKNKFTLYSNPTQSLNFISKHTKADLSNYKKFNKQLELNGMVVHRGYVDMDGVYHIKKIDIDSNETLRACINDTAVIVTANDVYIEMVQFAKGMNKELRINNADSKSRMLMESVNWWNEKVRNARITGYLFLNGIGTGVRNMASATVHGMLNTHSLDFFKYLGNSKEIINRFDDVYTKVLAYYPSGTTNDIIRFCSEHADELNGLTVDEMLSIFGYYTSSASGGILSSLMSVKQSSNFGKLKELCKETPEVTDELINKAMVVYQKEADKHSYKVVKNHIAQKNSVRKALEEAGISGIALDKLTDLYYSYTPASNAFADTIRNKRGIFSYLKNVKAPDSTTSNKLMLGKSLLSNYVTMNTNVFSAAEDSVRYAMYRYYTEQLGYTASRANREIISAQFNYNARPQWLENFELLFPFSTFKMYNAQFWLKDMSDTFNSIRLMTKLTNNIGVGFDTEEIAELTRSALIREKINKGDIVLDEHGQIDEEESVDGVWTSMAQTIFGEEGVINLYQGQKRIYAELAGGIPIGRHHVFKVGNTFVEALNLMNSVITGVPEILNGNIPTLFKDSVYSPIRTLFNGMAYMHNNGWSAESFAKWYDDNYYDANDILPFWGSLCNLAINHMKNGRLNMQDIWMIVSNPQLKDEYLRTIGEQFLCISGTVLPNFVGTVYDTNYWDKPIGYDWYNQSDAYKKSHRFVFGVSYVPAFYAKNPSTYINYKAMYTKMGYTSEEAVQILGALYGTEDAKPPVKWEYNQELFDETLKYLLDQGYTMAESLDILMDESLWNRLPYALTRTDSPYATLQELCTTLGFDKAQAYDKMLQGMDRKLADIKQAAMLSNSAYYKMYNRLPDYIKYTDGMYSALRKYYASKGMDESEVFAAMMFGNGFITEKGDYITVTPAQVESMNKEVNNAYYEFMSHLPNWYKYEDGAVSRAVNYLKDKFGYNTQQARDYIVANNFYVDAAGNAKCLTPAEVQQRTEKNQKDFEEYYSTLPPAIKYEKGAYGRTLKYLVQERGMTEDEAKKLIQGGAYLTLDGRLIDCTDIERVKQYNTWAANQYGDKYEGYINTYGTKRTYTPRPRRPRKRYIRSARVQRPYKMRGNNSLTYSLVNVLNGSSFGTQRVFKTTLGYNSASAILSTKGNYPSTWRNVAQAYRRNLYKEHYAKYGMSRIDMRSGVWKGYSNASVTRLRRELVYASRRYRNRRAF